MKSRALKEKVAEASIGSMPALQSTWANAGIASSQAATKDANFTMPGTFAHIGRAGKSLARRRLRYRKKIALAEVGTAAALEFLVVAAQRIVLGHVADDDPVDRRIEDRQRFDLFLLETRDRGADILVGQQVEIVVGREVTGVLAIEHGFVLEVMESRHVELAQEHALFADHEDALGRADRVLGLNIAHRHAFLHDLGIRAHQAADGE